MGRPQNQRNRFLHLLTLGVVVSILSFGLMYWNGEAYLLRPCLKFVGFQDKGVARGSLASTLQSLVNRLGCGTWFFGLLQSASVKDLNPGGTLVLCVVGTVNVLAILAFGYFVYSRIRKAMTQSVREGSDSPEEQQGPPAPPPYSERAPTSTDEHSLNLHIRLRQTFTVDPGNSSNCRNRYEDDTSSYNSNPHHTTEPKVPMD